MKAGELRQKDIAALRKELEGLLREQFNLRIQRGSGQLAKPHQMRDARRNIARIKTIINEKARASL